MTHPHPPGEDAGRTNSQKNCSALRAFFARGGQKYAGEDKLNVIFCKFVHYGYLDYLDCDYLHTLSSRLMYELHHKSLFSKIKISRANKST